MTIGAIFACRHCHNMAYSSQNEAPHYRMLHKAQKLHQKLGGSGATDDFLPKPKGMHWRTFERKMDYIDRLSGTADLAMYHSIMRYINR